MSQTIPHRLSPLGVVLGCATFILGLANENVCADIMSLSSSSNYVGAVSGTPPYTGVTASNSSTAIPLNTTISVYDAPTDDAYAQTTIARISMQLKYSLATGQKPTNRRAKTIPGVIISQSPTRPHIPSPVLLRQPAPGFLTLTVIFSTLVRTPTFTTMTILPPALARI